MMNFNPFQETDRYSALGMALCLAIVAGMSADASSVRKGI